MVFTDIAVPKKTEYRNYSSGIYDRHDGNICGLPLLSNYLCSTLSLCDLISVPTYNTTELYLFRRDRFNKIQRNYENVWLWKDINIGPHGRYIFEIPVPHRPAHWMITAFSMSPSLGFGMLPKPIEVHLNLCIISRSKKFGQLLCFDW